jgi:predicted cation transporter
VGIAASVVSAAVAVAVVVLCGAALTMESTWKVLAKVRGAFRVTRGRDLIPLVW